MAFENVSILKGRLKVAAKGKVSSNFWVSEGFSAVKGIANVNKVGPESLIRITQGVDPSKADRERVIKMYDPQCDIKIVEPVCATFVRVDYENDLNEQVEVAIDISLKKERIERDELKYRDFLNTAPTIAAGSDFGDNIINIQQILGRPVSSLHIKLPLATDIINVKLNDDATEPFEVKGERRWTPDDDQLEICRIFIANPGGAGIVATIFGT